jgi:hypothetical protein
MFVMNRCWKRKTGKNRKPRTIKADNKNDYSLLASFFYSKQKHE